MHEKIPISFTEKFCVTIFMLLLVGVLFPLAKAEEQLITAPLDELLPSREDIPSEWWTGSSSSKTLNEPGFVEGKMVSYYKEFGEWSEMDVEFCVYRFSDANSAKTYCDKKVNNLKSEGGYTEVAIPRALA